MSHQNRLLSSTADSFDYAAKTSDLPSTPLRLLIDASFIPALVLQIGEFCFGRKFFSKWTDHDITASDVVLESLV